MQEEGVERGQHTHRPLEFLSMMGERMAPTVPLISTLIVPAALLMRGSVKSTRSPPHPGGILALRGSVESSPVLGRLFFISCHFPPRLGGISYPQHHWQGPAWNPHVAPCWDTVALLKEAVCNPSATPILVYYPPVRGFFFCGSLLKGV